MRAGVIVTAVLGLGTAVVFAVAALTATLFPNGTVVGGGINRVMLDRGFVGGGVPLPAPIEAAPPDVVPDEITAEPDELGTDSGVTTVTDPLPGTIEDGTPEP